MKIVRGAGKRGTDNSPGEKKTNGTTSRVLVLLAAHGEAAGSGFREHYSVSWRTLAHAADVMSLPAPLRFVICLLGAARKSRDRNSGSRHNALTQRQARALEATLGDDTLHSYQVKAVFASAEPGMGQALQTADRPATVLVHSMIPTDSRLSCGHSCRTAHALAEDAEVLPLSRLWDDPELIAVHEAHLAEQLATIGGEKKADPQCALVVVLHGTLLTDGKGHPPGFHNGEKEKTRYGEQLQSALAGMPDRPWQRVVVAYLNHAVGGHWSQPELTRCLEQLAQDGVHRAFIYAAEHLVDGAETSRLGQTLQDSPLEGGHCFPCLNDSPRFIDYLADRVRKAVAGQSMLACDHCLLNGLDRHTR